MNEQDLAQFESVCQQLYEPQTSGLVRQAEEALSGLYESPNVLQQCQYILDRSQSAYAQLVACNTLTRVMGKSSNTYTVNERLQLRDYLLQYMFGRPQLPQFVLQACIQLVGKLTKHGWFDSDKGTYIFRDILDKVHVFLTNSVPLCICGVQILHQLVEEMNQSETMRSLTKHRKIASSFKDELLFEIFNLSCSLLRQTNCQEDHQHGLIGWLLKLVAVCLSFDFIGTSLDESSDDLAVVQIPANWRSVFMDSSTLQLFFELYQNLPPEVASQSLTCLVQLASVRRSLFHPPERATFLGNLVKGVCSILQHHATALTLDTTCYHEFCRLLTRLKSNYQLAELVKLNDYATFIQLVAQFTISSLRSWQFSANSIHYLLSLWQRLVASLPYLNDGDNAHHLETCVPEITQAYVTSRLESVETVLTEGGDNLLDDTPTIGMQLEQISTISRCKYSKTYQLLISLVEQTGRSYQEMLEQTGPLHKEIELREGQLSWIVYLISSVIGGRMSYAEEEESDRLDGELIVRVLSLMDFTDRHLNKRGCEYLELAYLSFFEQFRKVYVGDTMQKNTVVYQTLTSHLGVVDETAIVNVIAQKIVSNLKYWSTRVAVINKTLHLLSDLSIGFSSVRKLLTLDIVKFTMEGHTAENFPFLSASKQMNMKNRYIFYSALGRLLLCDLGEDEDKFLQFMGPLSVNFERIRTLMAQGQGVDVEEVKLMLIGMCHDLRGIVSVFNSRVPYLMLFEWIYPNYTEILTQSLKIWFHDPDVTTPVLKLISELVLNRSQRLSFDATSPNGFLLFKEASKAIVNYGERISTVNPSEDQLHALKLKGMSICFNILKSSLSGNYVNFGVFKLYGDRALDDSLQMFVDLLVSVPLKSLLAYPKVSLSYYNLLEMLTLGHIDFLCNVNPKVFGYIMSSISEGIGSLDSMVSTNCCSAMDHIATFIFKRLQKRNKSANQQPVLTPMEQGLQMQPQILQQMMSSILNIIMYEECRNQWSMSRPLLPLLLLNEEFFQSYRTNVISMQTPNKQSSMSLCFEHLMDSIECNLLPKNRDRFTQNLSVFRRETYNSLKESTSTTGTGPEMMV